MELHRVGILGLGEMGSAWARALRSRAVGVFSYLSGRSPGTLERAREAGVQDCASRSELLDSCELLVSIVHPQEAPLVAREMARAAAAARSRPLYLEANAVSPETAMGIGRVLGTAGIDMVDGGIIGSARLLARGTVTFLSGARAPDLLELQRVGIAVRIVGSEVGQASALKMLNAGIQKGITVLLTELLCGSYRLGILEETLRLYEERFPGLVERLGSQMVGNARNGIRRAQEMEELAAAFSRLGLRTFLIPATGEALSRIGADPRRRRTVEGSGEGAEGLAEFIARLCGPGGPLEAGNPVR